MTTGDEPRPHHPQTGPLHASTPIRRPGSGGIVRSLLAAVVVAVLTGGAVFGADWYVGDPEVVVEAAPADVPVVLVTPSPSADSNLTANDIQLAWGPSIADMTAARETAAAMTVEEAAGQVIVGVFSGRDTSAVREQILKYHLGGVIFMGGNVGSRNQTTALTAAALQAGVDDGRDWPVIVSVDQEGGTVSRLGSLTPEMPAFMAAGAAADKSVVTEVYAEFGQDITALGFNVDYAPVADVTIGLDDPVIRSRSAGQNPERVGNTVVAAMNGYLDAGLLTSIKHFPGHGSVTTDSHSALPVQDKSIASLAKSDLVPFQMAIDAGAPMIMMSHVAVKAWGSNPSTLDADAYNYLREDMGFTGVVITDALNMAAVTRRYDPDEAAVGALQAGADLLLMPENTGEAHAGIVAAVKSGKLSRARLNDAAARSIAMMRWQAAIDPELQAPIDGDYVRLLSQTGATVVAPLCGKRLVGSTVSISGGWSSERNALAKALEAHGVTVVNWGGTHVRIHGTADGGSDADVVVAMDGPWGLSGARADAYIGLYGRGDSSLAALADILVGQAAPQSKWPVNVGRMPYGACPSVR